MTHISHYPPVCNALEADNGALRDAILYHLQYSCGSTKKEATQGELARAVMLAVRDLLTERMLATEKRYQQHNAKRLYYLSMEFHLGRTLGNVLANLGLTTLLARTMEELGVDLEEIREQESDGALGTGGLARLAACFLDSLATLDMPGFGYGLKYQFGLFRQELVQGYQKELPGRWDTEHNPWLISRPDEVFAIPMYGRVEPSRGRNNRYAPVWQDQKFVLGIPHDMPIAGAGGKTVNTLRLFSARSADAFDIQIFTANDYFQAIRHQLFSESVSKMLYPSDVDDQSLEMRLKQEYFLVACTIQDIMKKYLKTGGEISNFAQNTAIQLNDTNPALAIAELMRCLVDEHQLDWDNSWDITRATCAYTSHTLVPEAYEKWPVQLFEKVLPRHLQIIYEINHRFLHEVRLRYPDDENAPTRMSLIEETGGRQLNMAHLAIIGSHSVNGVAGLHSQLLRDNVFPDFADMFPERFSNKTNGVTQRRWLYKANPPLANLITSAIGNEWIIRAETLSRLDEFAADSQFQKQFAETRNHNKRSLADHIMRVTGLVINPDSLFDVQIKRVHEYKRQLLHLLYIIHCYRAIIEDGEPPQVPRTHIFAGKAAPGDPAAKLIIKLINNIGQVINRDTRTRDMLKVVMLPDFGVSLAEKIIPAADLSEQISMAGTEASGTGNMKLAMNGALTIGTRDGSNIEIMEEVGADNFFTFGLDADTIEELRTENSYNAWDYYADNPLIRRAVDCLDSDMFCQEEPGLFRDIFASLMYEGDYFFHLADLESYIDTQQQVNELYTHPASWRKKAILNIARSGKFSSDRTVMEYAETIWQLKPVV
ncbi:glycogen/starch/alpha-glucan phosphorylase [Desulfopila aestuarii]|uniref:Alpha-1,4 glucan phosphorylase n=1 Tax=Desulfopila aestuarii DSM 18488 TaxID=1121416 RepID=A0A1M7YCT2_9BACT|nr:glycogen/starch/alpha-glucan phosphorylase [Desulfopila aestuarii]SHO50444.1 starch phosphorylase [Desulfopila aestuarii DSM 18488]